MRSCSIEGCDQPIKARGWCQRHYDAWRYVPKPRKPPWVNPLVCVCAVPDADLRRDAGMCHRCFRKPLALMNVRPVALSVVA